MLDSKNPENPENPNQKLSPMITKLVLGICFKYYTFLVEYNFLKGNKCLDTSNIFFQLLRSIVNFWPKLLLIDPSLPFSKKTSTEEDVSICRGNGMSNSGGSV